MDVYERVQEEDAKQASIIMATFVYHAAMRDEKLPRKPLDGEVIAAPTVQSAPDAAATTTPVPAVVVPALPVPATEAQPVGQ
jgi:hypothetical protein